MLLGITGADGVPGVSGHAGPRGLTGRTGKPGRPGRQGHPGRPGLNCAISAKQFHEMRENCEALAQEVETLRNYFNSIVRYFISPCYYLIMILALKFHKTLK